MDELDLVRLTRPPVDEPAPDALARLKTAALEAPIALPGDADAPDAPIELDIAAPVTPIRRRRGLVLTSIAAAVLTIGGGIAVATRDRNSRDRVGSADTSIATVAPGSASIGGTWVLTGAETGVPAPPDAPPVTLSFDVPGGGYGITVCTTLVGTSARVVDDRLVIDDTPTGIENGCQNASELAYQDRIVGLLRSRPTVRIEGNTLTLTNGNASLVLQRQGGTDHTLDGRTFRITALRDADTDIPVDSTHTIGFVDGRVTASTGCNGMGGTVQSVGTTLVVVDLGQTLMACGGDKAAREKAMVSLLGSRPSMELTDRVLRLSGGGVTLTAEEIVSTPATTTATTSATTAAPPRHLLDQRTYRITSLRDGVVDVPVTATNLLVFADGRVTAEVGCNHLSGTVESADLVLVVPQMESSAVGCSPDETAREALVWRLLTERPMIDIRDHDIRIVSDRRELVMVNVADPPTATTAPGRGGRVPTSDELRGHTFTWPQGDVAVTLSIDENGRAQVTAGCNLYSFSFTIVDGYLEATEPTVTEKACPTDVDKVEKEVASALVMRPLVTIEDRTLTVTNNPIVYVFTETS